MSHQTEDGGIQDFIFFRELAEVYLLLDNVSASSKKTLSGVADGLSPPKPGDGAAKPAGQISGNVRAWIEQICEVKWPPKPHHPEDQAKQAAILILAKDRLNALAYPATGATIAFTLLVAGEDNADRPPDAPANIWERAWAWMKGFVRPQKGGSPLSQTTDPSRPAPTRTSLARDAYPGLIGSARSFRINVILLILGLVMMLAVTCVLSWNLAVGNGLLVQLNEVTKQREQIEDQIARAEAAADVQKAGAVATDDKPYQPYCAYRDRPQAAVSPILPKNGAQVRLCETQARNRRAYDQAQLNLGEWLGHWTRLALMIGVNPPASTTDQAVSALPDSGKLGLPLRSQAWAVVLLNVLGANVLPICYGFVGAGAATVRTLSYKMRESLLSPRDLTLSVILMALGAVIGACIGLFVTPEGSDQAPGLLSSVKLSASALCFIAGFGVEGVFKALEGFMNRVFGTEEAGHKTN